MATEPSVHAGDLSLFSQVSFHIVESARLSAVHAAQLSRVLREHGAQEHSPPSRSGKVAFEGLTHIISSIIDFEGFEAAEDLLVPVVTPGWIETSLLKKRLANPKSHSPDPRLFFSGLVVCIVDLPEGDKDAIIGGVLAMGGLYSGALSKLVTHIVALNMDPHACQVAVARNLRCKIVLPHWFDDCLRLGKRIDEAPYLLPDPEVTSNRDEEGIPNLARPDLRTSMSAHGGRLRTPIGSPSQLRENLSVFKDKRIMLCEDLDIAFHLRETIEGLIGHGGGDITKTEKDADTLICQYREGSDYRSASIQGKTVGNLAWLYHLIVHNAWTSPFRRLLHYPVARGGLPGFKRFRISLSNYNGEARVYLENLAKAAGGEFTKTMKMDNTHLITAHTMSEKCNAAKEWNIHMINHLWLEESYAKWQIQSLSNPRYTHFPPRTNLTEVVGQTPIDKEALERHFYPKSSRTRDAGDRDMQSKKQDVEMDLPDKPKDQTPTRKTNALSTLAGKSGPQHEDRMSLQTPAPARLAADGKENETPSTTGSRGAKDRAAAKLQGMVGDIALFEREMKRVGGVTHGGRKPAEVSRKEPSRKRSMSMEDDASSETEDEPRKRARKGPPPIQMRLLMTGLEPKKVDEAKVRLRDLGVVVSEDYNKSTHIVASKILRTKKFLCAIAHGAIPLSVSFHEDCIKRQTLLPTKDYILRDPEGEKTYKIQLSKVIERAGYNRGKLLAGQSVYVTEHITGGFDQYKAIIEANGGKALLFRARAGPMPGTRGEGGNAGSDDDDGPATAPDFVYLVSVPEPADMKLWPKFRQMVEAAGKVPRVVRTDWMLDLALSQEVKWDETYEMTE